MTDRRDRGMKKKEIGILTILAVLAAAILLIGADRLFFHGPLGEFMKRPEFNSMAVELLLFFGWVLWFMAGEWDTRLQTGGILSAVFVFAWLHQAFTALAVSLLYLQYLIALGRLFIRVIHKGAWQPVTLEHVCAGFLAGSSIWITAVCVLSAFHIGGIPQLRLLAAVTAVPVFVLELIQIRKHHFITWADQKEAQWYPQGWQRYLLPLIVTMVALQVGRMNVALDYDSLHYGLRSAYILNNGSGIYENLGNINLVYTYSKGLEVLVLPLCLKTSYSFVLAFNVWVTVGILVMVYAITSKAAGKGCGLAAAAITSCIPAVTNMGITAKSDSITLLLQLFILYFMIILISQEKREERTRCLVLSGGACMLTYLLKPTALVFSTAVLGMSLLYILFTGRWKMKLKSSWWFCLIPVVFAWIGIWARTFLMTGVPITSVFTSVFGLFGLSVRWPFAFAEIPNNQEAGGWFSRVCFLSGRLFRMFTAPVGQDMDHVIIAWGTGVIAVLLAAAVILWILNRLNRKKEAAVTAYLWTVFLPLTVVCLISIRRLWQVDGNYFMLYYVMTVLLCLIMVNRCSLKRVKRGLGWILGPMLLFNVLVTALTNWSGFIGFSAPRLLHAGYYNHLEENRMQQALRGNAAIWDILSADPKTRVLAMGEHPEVLSFPCNIQSYYDLTGSGGNVRLVKTLDDFKAFLRYAGTEYLYIQARYLEEESRAADIVRYMIEDGSLADIRYEYGNVIAVLNLDGTRPVTPESSLEEFKTYQFKR